MKKKMKRFLNQPKILLIYQKRECKMEEIKTISPAGTIPPAEKKTGMHLFIELVNVLGTSTKTNDKLDALSAYFSQAPHPDKVWVIAIFSGRRPKRAVNSTQLSLWCLEMINMPAWLFEECYHTVGDLAETIALLLPPRSNDQQPQSLSWYIDQIIILQKQEEALKKEFIINSWMQMDQEERFVFNKLLTGGFRIGVSQKTMVNALAKTVKLDASVIAHRISGNWDPVTTEFTQLLSEESVSMDFFQALPFLPGLCIGRRYSYTRQSDRLAGRMEMGWHTWTDDKKK